MGGLSLEDSKDDLCPSGTERAEQYRTNLQALAAHQPGWARRLEATPIPDTVTPAAGRDGSATFRLLDSAGKLCWLGQTSMPTVSSAALVADFTDCAPTGGNVVLPGVLSGLEAVALTNKLARHCAVFVWQDEALPLKLAMHLYDYGAMLESGRLVFIPAQEPVEGLREFFQRNSGYEFPARMVRAPHLSPGELGQIQNTIEMAGQDVAQVHQDAVARSLQRITSRRFEHGQTSLPMAPSSEPVPSEPRVAVLTVDARDRTLQSVRMIDRALESLGWRHAVCAPDTPRHCHTAARLHAIEQIEADVVLFVNCVPGQLGAMLPRGLPLVTWYLPETAVGPGLAGASDTPFLLCVSTPWLREAALRAGVDQDRVKLVEVGAQTEVFRRTTGATGNSSARAATESSGGQAASGTHPGGTVFQPMSSPARCRRHDVGLVVELPEDRPEAANLILPSHVQLYEALRDRCRRHIERYSDDLAPKLLEQAERRTGIELKDEILREQFVALIRSRIAPVAFARLVVSTLQERGRSVRVWGRVAHGFSSGERVAHRFSGGGRCGTGLDPVDELDCRPLADTDDVNELYETSRIVLIPVPTQETTQLLLDGLLAGATVACREPAQGVEAAHPQLAPVFRDVHWFTSAAQAAATVDRILSRGNAGVGDGTGGAPTAEAMGHPSKAMGRPPRAALIAEDHSVQSRLVQIMALVREHHLVN